jgi:hypothetical protein
VSLTVVVAHICQMQLAVLREIIARLRRKRDAAHRRYQPSPPGSTVRLMLLQSICLAGIFKDCVARGDLLTAHLVVLQLAHRAELTSDVHCTIAAYTCMVRFGHLSDNYDLASEYEVSLASTAVRRHADFDLPISVSRSAIAKVMKLSCWFELK